MAATAAFYHRVLRKSPLAEGARAYLTERGVTWEMAERFQLGFSPDEQQVIKGARTKGFADRELDEMGITRRGRTGPVDRMAGRLIFTLFDSRGHPIAFAGRRLPPDESGPKYVNSPETPLWKKGSTLYGLHLARTAIAKAEEAIVVEGYTDVIGLVQAGYDNVVASMGTALTQPQLRELRKLARHVVLLFDADTAGSEAALRGLELAASPDIDLRVRVALPPKGSDPAEVAASGREAVDRMLGKAQSVLAFRVGLVLGAADTAYDARARGGLRGAPGRSCAACRATPERDELVRLAASRLRLPADAAARLAPARVARRRATEEEPPARLRMDAAQRDEWLLLALALASGDAGSAMLARIPPEAFTHDELQSAHAWVRARLNQDEAPSVSDVQRLEAQLVALAARHGGPEALREVAGRVESRWIARRLEPLKEKLAAAEITPEEMSQLQELQALARSARGE